MFRALIIAACLLVAACTTTDTRLARSITNPAPGATVLLVKPDIELSLMTAAGLLEARADWTQQGAENLEAALESALASSQYTIRPVDPSEATMGRVGQLLRLHEAVGQSILVFDYGVHKLPTKETFDWTLGEGARSLAEEYGADYALFAYGRGSYASGGRVATMVALSLVGVGVPLGGQQAFVSLVDLRTGQVIWFNVATASSQSDMRDPVGAAGLVAALLKDAPL